ncbi:MAG: hypothetical protein ACREMQ_16875, partial [Longimicrobiales bacterium]
VSFSIVAGDGIAVDTGVVSDAGGAATTAWILGARPDARHILRARVDGVSVDIEAEAVAPQISATYRGRNGYIDYRPGDLPIVITAPHGGLMQPAEIPDRTQGTTGRDVNTDLLAEAIAQAFASATGGKRPHIIINRLHRVKLDANREIVEAANGDRYAERAWHEFHAFTEAARWAVEDAFDAGFYIDLHGHAHPVARLELGYLLSSTDLALPPAALNALANQSSIRALAARGPPTFVELLRGANSLGSLLEAAGYPAVPSGPQPDPGAEPYFSGGYNTGRHGSLDGGVIDGVQIEANFAGVRDTEANRALFAAALAQRFRAFFSAHYFSLEPTLVPNR